ncbi:MAG TPA: GAF domain-containing protein [Chloroflexia bacterium]|nr:GAF domain-containing protein [Chloroflexia bacterium]
MKQLLAQLLDAQLPFLATHWPPDAPALAGPAPLFQYQEIADTIHTGDYAPWLARLRQRGAAWASQGGEVPALVAEAMRLINTLRATVFADGQRMAEEAHAIGQELDDLLTQVIAALVSGYFQGQEKRADEQRLALDELAALFKINSAANSTLDFDQVLDRVVEHVIAVMRTDVCSLFIYEPEIDRLVLRATRGLVPEAIGRIRLRLGEGVTGWAARAGKPLALSNGWQDDRFMHVPESGEERTRAILAVPIVLFTKIKLVGVITLQSFDERHFTERDISFLETVAGEVAIAIENARLHRDTDERLRQKVAELTILQGVSASIAATLNVQEVAHLIASEAVHLMTADAAVFYELREHRLVPMAAYGFAPDEHLLTSKEGQTARAGEQAPIPLPPPIDPQQSIVGRAILAGRPIGIDARQGAEPGPALPALAADLSLTLPGVGMDAVTPLWITGDLDGLPFATQLCVPMLAPRSIVGGIGIYSRVPRLFGEEQISLLLAFAREGAIAIENAHLYEETRRGLEMQTLLLREMHHRVRNNLQRMASLLRMQANRLPDDNAARHPLQESIIRIQSIARVHDLLSRQQVGLTEVGAVANLACEVVNNTLGRPDLRVRWHVEAAPVTLSSREAFPLTLLLTELLSNSVLHGFTGREEGLVAIKATTAHDQVVLVVTDNGLGLAPGFDAVRDAHLGLEVVRRLGEQELGGRLVMGANPDGPGTRTVITFPYQRPDGPAPTEADRALNGSAVTKIGASGLPDALHPALSTQD